MYDQRCGGARVRTPADVRSTLRNGCSFDNDAVNTVGTQPMTPRLRVSLADQGAE